MSYPDWLIIDIRTINLFIGTENLRHNLKDGYAEVCFDLKYDEYAQVQDGRLLNPEPIKLLYKVSLFPSVPVFLSDRSSFPKDLPHLNPVKNGEPSSICLWRKGGNSTLYTQKGITACLEVLKEWLTDASLGVLQHDGWEPTPRGGLVTMNVNLARWQEECVKVKKCGKILYTKSKAFISEVSKDLHVGWILPEEKFIEKNNDSSFLRPFKLGTLSEIKTYLLIPDSNLIEDKHNPIKLDSFKALESYSSNPLISKFIKFCLSCKKPTGSSAAIITIAQRRPIPLLKETPSLSNNQEAKKVEITSTLIIHCESAFKFYPLDIKSHATSEILASVSGVNIIDTEVGLLGCGSVGSAIAEYLARSGHSKLTVWDNDTFEAHNNARHTLHQTSYETACSFSEFKVYKLKRKLKEVSSDISIRSFPYKFDEQQLPQLKNINHIIDATGEIIEPAWLNNLTKPYTRVFIADEGRLAFILSQKPNLPVDIMDLEAALFTRSSSNETIRAWLQRESKLSNKMIGLGCSSATMEMPWYKINNHVSALMPKLRNQLETPGVYAAMNVIDKEGCPLGLTEFDVNHEDFTFDKQEVADETGKIWTISISQSALSKIKSIRENHLPSEAAGYILGLYNTISRRICIAVATKGNFTSSSTEAVLQSIDNDTQSIKVLEDSNNMLVPLGTWHSHPGTSALPSKKDKLTFKQLLGCQERVIPTIMVIKAKMDTHFMVGLNRKI
jgi:proteasome lid subunit RPN8/RPN11